MIGVRLQKVLSQAGVGSRREVESWIKAGLVQVNGVLAKLGDKVLPQHKIAVRGQEIVNPLNIAQKTRILLYHKPIGEISSRSDPLHMSTVFHRLPKLQNGRWVSVGRLDLNTSGLLVFTNNGELANRLMHPKYQIEREYAVRVYGQVSDDTVKVLLAGVALDDGMAKFKRIVFRGGEGTNSWYHVTLTEGRNREVRRLWESQGIQVSRLIRIRYGRLAMPRNLSRGDIHELSLEEVDKFIAGLHDA